MYIKKHIRLVIGFSAIAALLIISTSTFATPDYPITQRGYKVGEKLSYEFGWKNIKAAKAEVWIGEEVFEGEKTLKIMAKARTDGFVRRLWKMDGYAESLVHPNNLKPIKYYMDETENGLRTKMGIAFDHSKKVATSVRRRSGKTRKRELPFNSMHDPLSVAMTIRSIDLKPGQEKMFEITEGSHKWILKIRVLKREKIEVKAGTFNALKIVPLFTEIGRDPRRIPDEPKLKEAFLWISDDINRYLVKLESKVFVGRVYAELTKISK